MLTEASGQQVVNTALPFGAPLPVDGQPARATVQPDLQHLVHALDGLGLERAPVDVAPAVVGGDEAGFRGEDTDTTRAAVDIKVLIEQMREQVQNVE